MDKVSRRENTKNMDKGAEVGGGSDKLQLPQSSTLLQPKNLIAATTDDYLREIFRQIKASKNPTVINYGASWCGVCSQILPAFCQLSNKFPKISFVYADIDDCPEMTQHIRYTPTFHFYRDGERVDEMFGAGEERLYDRLWLHS